MDKVVSKVRALLNKHLRDPAVMDRVNDGDYEIFDTIGEYDVRICAFSGDFWVSYMGEVIAYWNGLDDELNVLDQTKFAQVKLAA